MPLSPIAPLPFSPRKVIARRAALELFPGAICNLGSGISTGIASIAAEEGALDAVVLTNEQGLIGGAPATGNEVRRQPQLPGDGRPALSVRFLRRRRPRPRVPVLRRGRRATATSMSAASATRSSAPGGFINISQNAQTMVFSGTFTSGGRDDRLAGRRTAHHARRPRQEVRRQGAAGLAIPARLPTSAASGRFYVTERAVFRRNEDGKLELIEIAPGVDLERDVLAHMEFRPAISPRPEADGRGESSCRSRWGSRQSSRQTRQPQRSARLARFLSGEAS